MLSKWAQFAMRSCESIGKFVCFYLIRFNLFAQFHLSRFFGTFLFYEFVIFIECTFSLVEWMCFNALRLAKPITQDACWCAFLFFFLLFLAPFVVGISSAMFFAFFLSAEFIPLQCQSNFKVNQMPFQFTRAFRMRNVKFVVRWMEIFVNFVYLFRFVFLWVDWISDHNACLHSHSIKHFRFLYELNIIFTLHWKWLITPLWWKSGRATEADPESRETKTTTDGLFNAFAFFFTQSQLFSKCFRISSK